MDRGFALLVSPASLALVWISRLLPGIQKDECLILTGEIASESSDEKKLTADYADETGFKTKCAVP